MTAILDELERNIAVALDDTPRWEQGTIFEIESERQQLRKDHDALHDRLAEIPAMREQERAALERRYADPVSRWFPAAVTFLVPASSRRAPADAAAANFKNDSPPGTVPGPHAKPKTICATACRMVRPAPP